MLLIFKNSLRVMVSLVLLISMSGCASNTVFSPAEKAAIHNVSVNPKVNMPQGISYYSSAQMGAMLGGGLLGYAIADGATSGKREHITSEMKKNSIAVDAMLKESLVDKI